MQGSIRKRGSTWSWSFDLGYVNGKRKRKEKGGYRTKAECQTALREAIKQYENCGSVFEPSEITVADYMDFWLEKYIKPNSKFNTILLYTRYTKLHILPVIGSFKLKSVTPLILQELINDMFNRHYSKSVIDSIFGILSKSFRQAVYPYQYIKENPMSYVEKPKYEKTSAREHNRIISKEEFDKIIQKYHQGTPYYIPLMIMYYTGVRIGECLALTWENIDLAKSEIHIEYSLLSLKNNGNYKLSTPKTPTSTRTIPISRNLTNILKAHKKYQAENRLFYGQYEPLKNFV